MNKFICTLCVMAISVTTYSQNSIEGSILNSETNEPVIAATIYLPQLERGTMTSADGEFSLNNIPEGSFQLIISSLGFTTQTVDVKTYLTKPLIIQLQASAIEMEAVIVSTPFHKLQRDNVVLVARETVDNLNKSGAVSLAEGITQIPGVESITTGAGIGKPVIRGLSANRVLVYTQGVRLENQQFGDEHGLGVSSSGVESVEVIKGPASLLYGSDALGGVLYLNPEKYAIPDSTEVDVKISYHTNSLGTEANAGFKKSGERLKFLLRGNYAANSDYKTGNDLRVTNSRFEEIDIKTGLGYQDTNYRGDLRYNYNNTNTGIPEEIGEQSTSKDRLLPNQQLDNHILSFDNKLFLKNSSLDLKVGYLFNNRKEFEEHLENLEANTPALEMHLETLNYDVKYNSSKWGNFEAIFGVQGMFQTNKNFGKEILIPDANVADIGFLATSHYHLEKVDFQAGLRFDSRKIDSEEHGVFGEEKYFAPIERDFTSYNGALGVKFDIFNSLIARVNVATGFRAPNLAELTSNGIHEGTNRYEIGNPNLDNEQNFQMDVVLEYRDEHFELFANSFYNKINNYIFLSPSGEIIDQNPVFEYVQNDARLYGGEAGLHLHPHPLDWLHLESSVEMVRGEQENDKNLPLIPATSFTNTLRIEFEHYKFLDSSYGFITLKSTLSQNVISEFETNTPGYSLLSTGIGSSLKIKGQTLDFRISGTNLLDKTYISHLSRLKQDGIPNRGRNITLSLQTSF